MVLVRVSKGCECIFVKIPVDFDAKVKVIQVHVCIYASCDMNVVLTLCLTR